MLVFGQRSVERIRDDLASSVEHAWLGETRSCVVEQEAPGHFLQDSFSWPCGSAQGLLAWRLADVEDLRHVQADIAANDVALRHQKRSTARHGYREVGWTETLGAWGRVPYLKGAGL